LTKELSTITVERWEILGSGGELQIKLSSGHTVQVNPYANPSADVRNLKLLLQDTSIISGMTINLTVPRWAYVKAG
jgi:hypothetical protein